MIFPVSVWPPSRRSTNVASRSDVSVKATPAFTVCGLTTASFDLLSQAVEMVRYDAPEVFWAIERSNPYALEVRRLLSEDDWSVNVELDQCWDLLRQRRALRETGRDPGDAHLRPPEVVEKYIG